MKFFTDRDIQAAAAAMEESITQIVIGNPDGTGPSTEYARVLAAEALAAVDRLWQNLAIEEIFGAPS